MSIWFPVIFITALYVIIAYGINKENAKYLLAGYNTLSEKERTKFDIVEYLKFFKSFFYRLAGYTFLLFGASLWVWDSHTALLIWAIGQGLPLPYLLYKGQQFKKK